MSNQIGPISLTLHALYDVEREAVGVDLKPSPAFEAVTDTKAVIETLAAITAKANFVAGEVIRSWDVDDARRQELVEHYAALKEHMLASMLHEVERREN